MSKEVKETLSPQSEAQRRFLNCKSDLVIYGGGAGSGKSFQALMLPLKYIKDKNFRAIFLRESSPQLNQAGGLWSEAQQMYRPFGAKFKSHPKMVAEFPSGATIEFRALGSDKEIYNFDGSAVSLACFDEGQNHTEVQIRYLESRIRSKAKGPHQLIITCNPKRDSYLLQFVEPYLDEEGVPRPELWAKERFYGAYNGVIVTAWTKEDLLEKYPGISAQTYTFLAATIRDNPIMKKLNPAYVARLENLKRVERARLLEGSWYARESTSGVFKKDWVEMIDHPPTNVIARVRGYDTASSLPSEATPNPDWTAGVLVSRTTDGFYVVEHVERYRALVNGVLENMVNTDIKDKQYAGDVTVVIPKDPAASGAIANVFFVQYLSERGCFVKTEVVSGHRTKARNFQPFCALAEAGLVKVVRGDWNETFFSELEDFEDGNRQQKDDQVDALSSAVKQLMREVTIPSFSLPTLEKSSPIPRL